MLHGSVIGFSRSTGSTATREDVDGLLNPRGVLGARDSVFAICRSVFPDSVRVSLFWVIMH